jgi:hypothetical protein
VILTVTTFALIGAMRVGLAAWNFHQSGTVGPQMPLSAPYEYGDYTITDNAIGAVTEIVGFTLGLCILWVVWRAIRRLGSYFRRRVITPSLS